MLAKTALQGVSDDALYSLFHSIRHSAESGRMRGGQQSASELLKTPPRAHKDLVSYAAQLKTIKQLAEDRGDC